jgi:hypothetical protein
MRNLLVPTLALLAALSPLAGPSAQAQYPSPLPGAGGGYGAGFRGPTLSPYLNIIRGRNFGVDYYLGTRNLFRQRAFNAAVASDIDDLRGFSTGGMTAADVAVERPVQSGTQVTFGNSLGYYNNPVNFMAQTVGPLNAMPRGYTAPPRRSR